MLFFLLIRQFALERQGKNVFYMKLIKAIQQTNETKKMQKKPDEKTGFKVEKDDENNAFLYIFFIETKGKKLPS